MILNQIESVHAGFYTMRLIGKKRIKCKKGLRYQKPCPHMSFLIFLFILYDNNNAYF